MERVSEVVRVESKSRRRLMRSKGVREWRRNVDVDICLARVGVGLEKRASRVSRVSVEKEKGRSRI